jgi:threonine dehydrogenase-like Zn-dependent dehydrogenase
MAPDYVQKVIELTGGKGPEIVVEVTGNIHALQQVLECVAKNGRVVLLGCTRISDQAINVYKYIHCKGVYLIGAHTSCRPQQDPAHWGASEPDDYKTFFKYVQSGRLQIAPLISEVASPRDAEAIYQKIGMQENPPLGILLDWTDIDPIEE